MTIKDLIRLCDNDLNKMIILEDPNGGWCNVDINKQDKNTVYICQERQPIFHDK